MKFGFPLLLRAAVFAALLLPLSGLFDGRPFVELESVLVLDDSASMRSRFPELDGALTAGEGPFEGLKGPVVAVRDRPLPHGTERGTEESFTDLASALEFSLSLFSPRAEKRILLVTDGLADPEATARAAEILARQKAKVFALRPSGPIRRTGVLDISLPGSVFLWEPFLIKGRITSSQPGKVHVILLRNGVEVMKKTVNVGPTGIRGVEFLQEAEQAGTLRFSLALEEGKGPKVSGEILVAGKPRVLYVVGDLEAAGKLISLYRDAGIEVDTLPATELAGEDHILNDWDAIILDDVPVPSLSGPFEDRVRQAVGVGGRGLIVIGGRRSLGSEAFQHTSLEAMLPVTTGYSAPPPPSSIALVLAMDTSFSMYARGQGGRTGRDMGEPRKIDVAKDSAIELVRALRGEDKFGVIGNSTDLYWIQELAAVPSPDEVIGKVEKVKAIGGGINFYSIVREAYLALREDTSPVRHVIIFCDSDDIDQYEVAGEGHSYDLIRSMAEEGITLSILAIGSISDKDVPFLRTSAMIGQGDFYLISNLMALPRYFVSEYRKLVSRYYLEEETEVYAGDAAPLLYGLEGAFPPLAGTNTVTSREGGVTPLLTSHDTPLVALGRFGKGKIAVFASDNGHRWAQPWFNWAYSSKFWTQLLFSVLPEQKEGIMDGDPRAFMAGNRFILSFRPRDGGLPSWDHLWMSYGDEDTSAGMVKLTRTGLRTYESPPSLPEPGFLRATLFTDEEGDEMFTRTSVTVPIPPEGLALPENWELVDRLVKTTGGKWIADPGEIGEEMFLSGPGRGKWFLVSLVLGVTLLLVETIVKQSPWR